ncbi:hypothetical protein [Flavobacterium sp. NKUCC04_CG]|uniref:hypothetical protein n=1 Tax=Flavobacterium sp. NKUCC04_CG TaxID=2842121 RepID=UPI001C5B8774|nr:hypothetical protein [Flavobacterium sp. NKUCC04_CG]MBW3518826.1 hypothetical protein [Flavobacterium sp. NKUCC04_CG]
MKKTLILSISLMALCTACSVESDSVVSVSNKEQVVKSTSISDLTSASLTLTKYFYNNNNSEMEIGELVKTVDGLAKSDSFLKEYSFLANAYASVSTEDISRIVDKDWSVLDNVMYSSEFQMQVLKMVNGEENLDSYSKEIASNPDLNLSEKQILFDGIKMSVVSLETGVDDEWRKRKFMGYLVAQYDNDLTVVITATVLDIAMKQ